MCASLHSFSSSRLLRSTGNVGVHVEPPLDGDREVAAGRCEHVGVWFSSALERTGWLTNVSVDNGLLLICLGNDVAKRVDDGRVAVLDVSMFLEG